MRTSSTCLVKTQVSENLILTDLDAAALRGTNCFIIGTASERLMIDSGDIPPINHLFIENMRKLLLEEGFRLKVNTPSSSR